MENNEGENMQVERRIEKSAIWTLDKRIPLPLVLALIGQMAAGIWFAAGVVSKQDQHDRDIAAIKNSQSEIRQVSDKMIRLEVLMENMSHKLTQFDAGRKSP